MLFSSQRIAATTIPASLQINDLDRFIGVYTMRASKKRNPKCYDCGRLYGNEYGFPDLVIPNWAWRAISPKGNGGGMLCPSCICKRLYEAKIQNCPSSFTSGPLAFDTKSWIR